MWGQILLNDIENGFDMGGVSVYDRSSWQDKMRLKGYDEADIVRFSEIYVVVFPPQFINSYMIHSGTVFTDPRVHTQVDFLIPK